MAAFAQDLERYLRGDPVLARPDSAWYRLRKFASRNQPLLRAVGVAVAATVAIGIGYVVYLSREHSASTARALELSADAIAERALPRTTPTRDVTAYREYLQARSLMLRPTEENLREILRLAESATTRDPNFAHAFSLLGGVNVLFLDIGYPRANALSLGEAAALRARALNPDHPGAYATLGSIAAHRGQWIAAEDEFRRAFALNDKSGRVHARHAQTVLLSVGRLDAARQGFQAEFRLTPSHARGAMQMATALVMLRGHETEALRFVEIAMSLGWPADAVDVRNLFWLTAMRAGDFDDAMENQTLAMPGAIRDADGAATIRLLHEALKSRAQREKALLALDGLNGRLRDAGTTSFATLMFSMNWYAMLGDLDRAFAASSQWLQLSADSGLSGIPHNAGFWLPEMSAFRADPRFESLASRSGTHGLVAKVRRARSLRAAREARLPGTGWLVESRREKQPCLLPVARDRTTAESQRFGHLFFRHPREVAHLDHAHQPFVDRGQLLQRFVDSHDFALARIGAATAESSSPDVHHISATPIGGAPPHEIDDDRAHDPRRVGHELRPVVRFQRTGFEQAHVRLVHEAGGIEQSADARFCAAGREPSDEGRGKAG